MQGRLLDLAILAVLLIAVSVFGVRVYTVVRPPLREVRASDTLTVHNWSGYGSEGIRLGPDSANVTIVEYGDFRCPLCKEAARYLENLRSRYPRTVAVVYRHYPSGDLAMATAIASQCAAEVGRFEAFHDVLLSDPERLGRDPWISLAQAAGIQDSSRFRDCMGNGVVVEAIVRDTLSAVELGVQGTPTFLINDLLVRGFLGRDQMDSLVTQALRKGLTSRPRR